MDGIEVRSAGGAEIQKQDRPNGNMVLHIATAKCAISCERITDSHTKIDYCAVWAGGGDTSPIGL